MQRALPSLRSVLTASARRAGVANNIARIQASTFATDAEGNFIEMKEWTEDGAISVHNTAFTIEWVLSSPPPLHCFEEPPIMVKWPPGEEGGH